MTTTIAKQTESTPSIIFNPETNTITIKGKSIPFEPETFWPANIHQIKNIKKPFTIEINLEYVNTNSIPYLAKIAAIENTRIIWICDQYDEDMIELGETIEYLSNI